MRRLRFAFAAGALVTAGALTYAWLARAPANPPASAPSPSPIGVAPEAAPAPEPETGGSHVVAVPEARPAPPSAPPESAARAEAASRADADLIALEDQALRRVDVVPLLERAGIDPRELKQRPDADDLLRHLAGDEVLTLLYMRDLFRFRGYPPDYPREAALREARTAAEGIVAKLDPAERAERLASELAKPPPPPPEPVYFPKH